MVSLSRILIVVGWLVLSHIIWFLIILVGGLSLRFPWLSSSRVIGRAVVGIGMLVLMWVLVGIILFLMVSIELRIVVGFIWFLVVELVVVIVRILLGMVVGSLSLFLVLELMWLGTISLLMSLMVLQLRWRGGFGLGLIRLLLCLLICLGLIDIGGIDEMWIDTRTYVFVFFYGGNVVCLFGS